MRIVLLPDAMKWATGSMSRELAAALPEDWEVIVHPTRGGSPRVWRDLLSNPPDIFYSWLWFWTRRWMSNWPDNYGDKFPGSKMLVGCTGYKKLKSSTWKAIIGNGHIVAMNTWAKIMYEIIKDEHPNVWLTRHGTDLETFKPMEGWDGEFRAGWIGNVHHSKKKPGILTDLDYPVVVHGRKAKLVQAPNIIQDIGLIPFHEMPSVYQKFNVYVCVSSAETGPLPVLEAAAMGMPVVSTAVGIVPELLQPEWVIEETNNRAIIAKEVNERLALLADDKELREEVGARNREEMEKNWSWKACIPKWVEYFESV
jgi:glycosyltransferase involved in cell wall biosynthesis